jgi:hypothetical protein
MSTSDVTLESNFSDESSPTGNPGLGSIVLDEPFSLFFTTSASTGDTLVD